MRTESPKKSPIPRLCISYLPVQVVAKDKEISGVSPNDGTGIVGRGEESRVLGHLEDVGRHQSGHGPSHRPERRFPRHEADVRAGDQGDVADLVVDLVTAGDVVVPDVDVHVEAGRVAQRVEGEATAAAGVHAGGAAVDAGASERGGWGKKTVSSQLGSETLHARSK